MIILVTGLPGSGKTTLAEALADLISAKHINADAVRKEFDDWDFSDKGRWRQAHRMAMMAKDAHPKPAILDFVCPTDELRDIVNADFVIFMDTIQAGRYEDTNALFEAPKKWNFRVLEFHAQNITWIMEALAL